MTVVILILLTLLKVGMYSTGAIKTYRLGREAGESLRDVYSAQRMYLADNPTAAVSSLTSSLLIQYLPNQATSMPTIKSLTGSTLSIKVTVFPPVVTDGGGTTYDPSGNSKDSLWDVGE